MNAQVQTMVALVRRELWEHRAFVRVPAVMACLVMLGLMIAIVQLSVNPDAEVMEKFSHSEFMAESGGPTFDKLVTLGALVVLVPGAITMLVMMIVNLFYMLDSLYGDRKDRSVLFWRSMPISDTQTVLSKLITAMFAGPMMSLATLAFAFVAWGVVSAIGSYMVGFPYWWVSINPLSWLDALVTLAGLTLGFLAIAAPFVGWFLFASAWAPRAPLLWGGVPMIALPLLEELVFRSEQFLELMLNQFAVLLPMLVEVEESVHHTDVILSSMALSAEFIAQPRFWGGLLVAAGFVALATYVRRFRDDAAY